MKLGAARARRAAADRLPALALACAAALLAILGPGPAAWAQAAAAEAPAITLTADDERPVLGQTVRLTVLAGATPLSGARVSAVYRPNSSTTSTEHLAPTDQAGTVFWTPSAAGPVNLQAWPPSVAEGAAPAVTVAVAVRYGGFPLSGLVIMLLAGALLLGGAAFGMTMLLRTPPDDAEPLPPSS
jgi:hypothetical protein